MEIKTLSSKSKGERINCQQTYATEYVKEVLQAGGKSNQMGTWSYTKKEHPKWQIMWVNIKDSFLISNLFKK